MHSLLLQHIFSQIIDFDLYWLHDFTCKKFKSLHFTFGVSIFSLNLLGNFIQDWKLGQDKHGYIEPNDI